VDKCVERKKYFLIFSCIKSPNGQIMCVVATM